jgi:putative SOS response-associated peptidase YedK
MCSNYLPPTPDRLRQHFGLDFPSTPMPPETYPGYFAPIIRLNVEQTEQQECVAACFGMVPHWAEMKLARQTYNARTETVAIKPSFRHAFKHRQFCIIPADGIFEPCYETGKAARWQIAHAKGQPLGVAGIWERRTVGEPHLSFSMLTINADAHPLMQRFHRAEDEKRMLVILEPHQYDDWLHATAEEARTFFAPYAADQLMAVAAPKPPISTSRKRSAA